MHWGIDVIKFENFTEIFVFGSDRYFVLAVISRFVDMWYIFSSLTLMSIYVKLFYFLYI